MAPRRELAAKMGLTRSQDIRREPAERGVELIIDLQVVRIDFGLRDVEQRRVDCSNRPGPARGIVGKIRAARHPLRKEVDDRVDRGRGNVVRLANLRVVERQTQARDPGRRENRTHGTSS